MNLKQMNNCLNAIDKGMLWCMAEQQLKIPSNSGYSQELIKIKSDRFMINQEMDFDDGCD